MSEIKEKWILASIPNELFEEAKRIYNNAPSSSMRYFGHDPLELLESQLQQLREELAEEKRHATLGWEQSNKWLEENGRMRDELDQVKKERDEHLENYIIENSNLTNALVELAEKDKVLEWYADESEDAARKFHLGLMNSDIGDRARSILSQYKKGDTKND